MAHIDPYDPSVAFDDLLGEEAGVRRGPTREDVARVMSLALARRARRRLAPPPFDVEVLGHDATPWTFQVIGFFVPLIPIIGEDVPEGRLPLFDSIRAKFAAALPKPKIARVDTPESHEKFRHERRAPYYAELERRLAALEAAVSAHVADDHGGGRLDALEDAFEQHMERYHGEDVLGAEVDAAMVRAAAGGQRIPLPLPAWARGKIECWQDGKEILCAVRAAGPDGRVRVITSGAQVEDCLGEALGCIGDDEDLEAVAVAVPALAQVFGGWSLAQEICGAAPDLLARREARSGAPFTALVRPDSDPTIAAAMALLQRCQRGDRRACAEAAALASARRGLFEDARDRLVRAQRDKARRMG